ncbi:MAG: hypothetical protein M3126_10360 [Candidatus Eremiobacteraeota bacterium]|nr:hypothetical protein [Candidatus Eremiobacteraeota bacterium]
MDVAPQLQSALSDARSSLAQNSARAALAQTNLGAPATDATMAGLAQAAIFSEALLSAMHARLAEIKAVTK